MITDSSHNRHARDHRGERERAESASRTLICEVLPTRPPRVCAAPQTILIEYRSLRTCGSRCSCRTRPEAVLKRRTRVELSASCITNINFWRSKFPSCFFNAPATLRGVVKCRVIFHSTHSLLLPLCLPACRVALPTRSSLPFSRAVHHLRYISAAPDCLGWSVWSGCDW